MFFILSKTVSYLLMPMSIVGMFWISYYVFKPWKYRKYLLATALFFFFLFSNDFIANTLLKMWQADAVVMDEIREKSYSYGVLLTGMTNTLKEPKDKVYFNQNADRLLQAIMLLEQGIIDTLIISGGGATALRKNLQEANVLKTYLESINFPLDRLLIEAKSRNTHESAQVLKEMIPQGASTLLISSASHIPRAQACMQKQNISTDAFPTVFLTSDNWVSPSMFLPSVAAVQKWEILIKECLGYVAYKLMGYL